MNDIIQIQCPDDGAVLAITNQPGLENKRVTCPVCKKSRPFTQYKKINSKGSKDDTALPESNGEKTTPGYGGCDQHNFTMENRSLGRLAVISTGEHYPLRSGRQVIGRKASSSQADIQIDTGDGRHMSRSHMVIEVSYVKGKGFVHCAKLFKDQCNDTFVNSVKLEAGDSIVLHHGDVLRLPDAELKFEIPDGEDTEHTIH